MRSASALATRASARRQAWSLSVTVAFMDALLVYAVPGADALGRRPEQPVQFLRPLLQRLDAPRHTIRAGQDRQHGPARLDLLSRMRNVRKLRQFPRTATVYRPLPRPARGEAQLALREQDRLAHAPLGRSQETGVRSQRSCT